MAKARIKHLGRVPVQGVSIRKTRVRQEFLKCLEQGWTIGRACKEVRVSRNAIYNWRNEDESFAVEWDAAVELGTDLLEEEAIRRGRDGVERGIYYKGTRIAKEREYSDRLLETILRARRPEKFNTTRTEVSGPKGGPIENVTYTSREEIEKALRDRGLPVPKLDD